MKKKIITIILSIVAILNVLSTSVIADDGSTSLSTLHEDLAALGYEPIFTDPSYDEPWYDPATYTVGITTYVNSEKVNKDNAPLIVYIINHHGEYPGTESDVSIVSDYLDEGYVVAVFDYSDEHFYGKHIECSVVRMCAKIRTGGEFLGDSGIKIDSETAFILPSGYRVARDVTYFEYVSNASQETLDYIVEAWNTVPEIKAKVGSKWAEAETIYDIVMADGTNMTAEDTQLKMDIIYPSNPNVTVPVIGFASTATPRNLYAYSTSRPHNNGFLFRGYAVAWYDHEYLPFMNKDLGGYGHIEPQFTVSNYEAVRAHTAAIRCIKFYADEYGYSKTKIGVFGHSKSSWSSLLSNPNAEKLPEYKGAATDKAQPFTTYANGDPINADITCLYHSMGNGSRHFSNYLTGSNIPTLIACGEKDTGDGCSYWENEKAAYVRSGIDFMAIDAIDDGHNYPYYNSPVYDYNLYNAFCKFFDYYLKDEAPTLLYTSVADGQIKEIKTNTAKYDENNEATHWSVIESDKLFVQFTAPVTEWSFLEAVSLKDSEGREVGGTWYAEGNGSKWIFEIDKKYVFDETYTLTIADGVVSDKYDRTVENGIEVSFTK